MITDKTAKEQIARMGGLRFFPDQRPALMELVKALVAVSKDDRHAEEIVSAWIQENENTPTPANFYQLKRTEFIQTIPITRIEDIQ